MQQMEAGSSRWSGKVKHRLGDSTVELFYLSALIPADTAEQMPTTLFVTELAPVGSCMLLQLLRALLAARDCCSIRIRPLYPLLPLRLTGECSDSVELGTRRHYQKMSASETMRHST